MNITLIGSGNLATNLGLALIGAGHTILEIYSRTLTAAQTLAEKLGAAQFTNDLSALNNQSDIYIISVTDTALASVAAAVLPGREDKLFVHTAGTLPMDTITAPRRGVFYPLQTFSKQRQVSFQHIPLFLETSQKTDLPLLQALAESLSDTVIQMTSDERRYLHLAAVFASNFTNHCATLAQEILERHGIPFQVMLPLMDETIAKLHRLPPVEAQTGPARRKDKNVQKSQKQLLETEYDSRMAEIYTLMSQSIEDHDKL